MSGPDAGSLAEREPEYIIVQPGLDGVAWLGEIIDGEPSPIGKVSEILDAAQPPAPQGGDAEALALEHLLARNMNNLYGTRDRVLRALNGWLAARDAEVERAVAERILTAIDEDMGHLAAPEVAWRDGYLAAMDVCERIARAEGA